MPRTITLTAKQFLKMQMDNAADIPSAVAEWCELAKLGQKAINQALDLPMHAKPHKGAYEGYSAEDIEFLKRVFDCKARSHLPRILFSDDWST